MMKQQHPDNRGPWLQTFSKGLYYPIDPRPEEVFMIDIAHALSNICRFGGHVPTHYSVAQHSVLVADILPPEFALWGLLHDAAEAYTGDVIRPVKLGTTKMEQAFREIEEKNQKVILGKFGLTLPMPPEVKKADDIALATEIRDLMGENHTSYSLCDCDVKPTAKVVFAWPADISKRMFLKRLEELTCT